MQLDEALTDIITKLKQGRFPNEQSISQGIVLRLLRVLDWDVDDTAVVCPEFSTGQQLGKKRGRVDFALCDPPLKPKCFIEVKQPGLIGEKTFEQAFQYAFHSGVQFMVITDGATWSFYLPGEEGSYEERRVFKLDLLERSNDESIKVLRRYLAQPRVASGESLDAARKEYRSRSRRLVARRTIPEAWRELIKEGNDQLTHLLAEAAESKAGIRPTDDDVANFLGKLSSGDIRSPAQKPPDPSTPAPTTPTEQPPKGHARGTIVFQGASFPYTSAKDAMVIVLRELAKGDPTFLERCAHHRAFQGRKRRHIAQHLDEIYPGRPDLQQNHHEELPGGWIVGTNLNNRSKMALVRAAAEVSGLTFGQDLIVDF